MEKDYLIKQWLNNSLTDAEKEIFMQSKEYLFYKDILDNAQHFKASNHSKVADFETFKQQYQAQKSSVKTINWYHPILKIAAILVVALGVYFAFLHHPVTEIQTLVNKEKLKLPDNSLVTLNASTEITFIKSKWNKSRKVTLDGEAYFDVEKGKTFNVVTANGTVTVVGTKFTVKQRGQYFEVQCYEGIVKVASQFEEKTLLAGDAFRILDNKLSLNKVKDTEPKWITNSSSFDALPLKEVFAELERQYGIKVNVTSIDTNRLFTGGFVHTHLENALNSITQPMDLSYEITANEVVINDANN